MSWIESIILGIVQGITEFLPVSSSGHLIIVPWFAGWDEPGLTFNVAVHMGTFLAVAIYFRSDIILMIRSVLTGIRKRNLVHDQMSRLAMLIVIGSIPAAIIGFAFGSQLDLFFHAGEGGSTAIIVVALMLIVVGIVMYYAERRFMRERTMAHLSWRDGIIVGFAQALALIPGTSRSGSTITAGLFLGLRREVAARFSFLLGIPAVFGAGLSEGANLLETGLSSHEQTIFGLGILVSTLVGYISIAFLLRFLQTNSVLVFTLYRCGLGSLMLILVAFGVL